MKSAARTAEKASSAKTVVQPEEGGGESGPRRVIGGGKPKQGIRSTVRKEGEDSPDPNKDTCTWSSVC